MRLHGADHEPTRRPDYRPVSISTRGAILFVGYLNLKA